MKGGFACQCSSVSEVPLWPLRLLCASSTCRRQHLLTPNSHLGFNLLISQEKPLGAAHRQQHSHRYHSSGLPCSVGLSRDLPLLLVPKDRTSKPPATDPQPCTEPAHGTGQHPCFCQQLGSIQCRHSWLDPNRIPHPLPLQPPTSSLTFLLRPSWWP